MTSASPVQELYELRANWNRWHDLYRAEAIVRLRSAGYSLRHLAKVAGCSEGLIRHIEIVGHLPRAWKDQLFHGYYSTRQLVAEWRRQQRAS